MGTIVYKWRISRSKQRIINAVIEHFKVDTETLEDTKNQVAGQRWIIPASMETDYGFVDNSISFMILTFFWDRFHLSVAMKRD